MQINDHLINAELEDILAELQRQMRLNGYSYLQKSPKKSGNSLQIQCPYHGNGQERNRSAGIRRSDGMFHCFQGDTKVITYEHGAIKIRKLVNKQVHILNGNGQWELVTFYNYGKQPLMKIILSCNTKKKIIYATPEHEWVIKDRHKKYQTQQLKKGMYLQKVIPQKINCTLDYLGVVHGFCYGDGNNYNHNKDYSVYYNKCFFFNEQDLELLPYFEKCNSVFKKGIAGNGKKYKYTLFKSNKNFKEVPSIQESDEYLLGFLAGYFVADGNCNKNSSLSIYSHDYKSLYKVQKICNKLGIVTNQIGKTFIPKGKRGCITVKEDTYGYTMRISRNTLPDHFFITEKGRHSSQKYNSKNCYKVLDVQKTDLIEDVFCCQTSTHSFALENFILTGNCFACNEIHTLPEVISYCFGHDDEEEPGKWGWKWILKNFAVIEVEERKDVKLDLERSTRRNNVTRNNDSNSNYIDNVTLDKYRYIHPYMYKRRLTDEIIEMFDIGYDKVTKCITFPVRDIHGNCLFLARRSVKKKFFQYPEGVEKPLYGLYELSCIAGWYGNQLSRVTGNGNVYVGLNWKEKIDEVIICESMLDALTCWVYGKYAVALNGLGNDLQFKQLRQLPVRKLILATDNDKRGMQARKRIADHVTNKLITQYVIPHIKRKDGKVTKDINDLEKSEFNRLEEII